MSSESLLKVCEYNDCGWCYYRGELEPNDSNGQCRQPETCPVRLAEWNEVVNLIQKEGGYD